MSLQTLRWLGKKLGFTGRAMLAFCIVDAVFKIVIVPAFVDVSVGVVDPVERAAAFGRAWTSGSVILPLWFISVVCSLQPVRMWLAGGTSRSPDEVGPALRRLPNLMAILWSLEWMLFIGSLAVRGPHSSAANASNLFFLGAMFLGPIPIAHGLMTVLVAPVVRDVSILEGKQKTAAKQSLRSRVAVYCLCIAVAPTSYMASLVTSEHLSGMSASHVLSTVMLFCLAIVFFSLLTAALFATTITKPVREMGEVMHALIEQGDVSNVARLPVHLYDEVGELAERTNHMLDRLEATEKERSLAASSLAVLNQTLEERVAKRTAALMRRTAEIRLVLDNVREALFAVTPSGEMPSADKLPKHLIEWFGAPEAGETFYAYFGRRAASGFADEASIGWAQLVDDFLPIEVTLDQLPKWIRADGRHYAISYQPINGDPEQRILIVVADETTRVEHENAEREKRETFAMLDHFLVERMVLLEFMEDSASIVSGLALLNNEVAVTSDQKRAIHTLKGNSLLFGLESVGEICHDIETAIEEGGSVRFQCARLIERWTRLEKQVERFTTGRRQRDIVELTSEDHAALERAIRHGVPRKQLARMVHDLKLEPISVRLNHLAEQARRLGSRMDKPLQVEVIDHDGVRLDARTLPWSSLWSAIVHPIRNAIDHGIESPSERASKSKPEVGCIRLRSERQGESVIVEIEDDGRGIAWELVASSCAQRGLRADTIEDLTDALFADGLSTRETVSEISGRGVGMGALRDAVNALGGRVEVHTQSGTGTRLRMIFPEASAGKVNVEALSYRPSLQC